MADDTPANTTNRNDSERPPAPTRSAGTPAGRRIATPPGAARPSSRAVWVVTALIGVALAIIVIGVLQNPHRTSRDKTAEQARFVEAAPTVAPLTPEARVEVAIVEPPGAGADAKSAVLGATPAQAPVAAHKRVLRGVTEGVGRDGDGYVTYADKRIYIPGAKANEDVSFVIETEGQWSGRGRLIERHVREEPAPVTDEIFEGLIAGVGSRGDGRLLLDGAPVFIPGTEPGQTVRFRLVERRERWSKGELVEVLDKAETASEKGAMSGAVEATQAVAAPPMPAIEPGAELTVRITGRDRDAPDTNGKAVVDGVVIIVPGTQPGDEVAIRILTRRGRLARAEKR